MMKCDCVGCVLGSEVRSGVVDCSLSFSLSGPGVTGNVSPVSPGHWSPSGRAAELPLDDLISLIEQSKTTGLTQTVETSSCFIPKDQRG